MVTKSFYLCHLEKSPNIVNVQNLIINAPGTDSVSGSGAVGIKIFGNN